MRTLLDPNPKYFWSQPDKNAVLRLKTNNFEGEGMSANGVYLLL